MPKYVELLCDNMCIAVKLVFKIILFSTKELDF